MGTLQIPKGPAAEGLFDYRSFLRHQGIHYFFQVERTNDWKLLLKSDSPRARPWSDRFRDWAQRVLAKGLPEEDEPLRLLWAMVLGWKPALTPEVAQPFMESGTLHVFAISGLHIALIAGILVSLLRVVQIPRGGCGVVVIPLIWFYTAATGWQASAIRSTVMMTIIIAGWALERPSLLLNLAGWSWSGHPDSGNRRNSSGRVSTVILRGVGWRSLPCRLRRSGSGCFSPIHFWPEELRPCWQRWGRAGLAWLTAVWQPSRGVARFTAINRLLFLHRDARQRGREFANRSAEHSRPGQQPGQPDLRRLADLVHRAFQLQFLVLDEAHDRAERMGGGFAQVFLLRPPANLDRICHLLPVAGRGFERVDFPAKAPEVGRARNLRNHRRIRLCPAAPQRRSADHCPAARRQRHCR
jgi:hypothetical protein